MGLRLHLDLGQQHGLPTPTWSLVALQAMLVLQEGPIQKVNLSISQASVITQSHRDPAARDKFRDCVCACLSSRLLHNVQATLLGNDTMYTSALFLTYHHQHISSSASLPSTCTGLFFYLSHLSTTYLFNVVASAWGLEARVALWSIPVFRPHPTDLFKDWKCLLLTHEVVVEKDTIQNKASLHGQYPRNTYERMWSLIP